MKMPFVNNSGLMLIEGSFDDEQGYFIFDTAADGVIIHKSDHLSGQAQEFNTINGSLLTFRLSETKIKLSNYLIDDLDLYASDLSEVQKVIDGKLLGILGSKVIAAELLCIDNTNKVIELYDRELFNEESKDHVFVKLPFELKDDLIVMPLGIGNKTYEFILDTGASVSIIDEQARILNEALFINRDRAFNLTTAHTDMTSNVYEVLSCNLAELRINNLQFGSADLDTMSNSLPEDVVGIISIDQLPLSQIIFDFEGQNIYFGI